MSNLTKNKLSKWVISIIVFVSIIGSSVIVAFASDDISSLLTNWFNDQTDSHIAEIDQKIEAEKEAQTARLEEEITAMIVDAEAELNQFTNDETERRVEQIETYADELIDDYDVDIESDQEEFIKALEEIIVNAKLEMEELADEHGINNNDDE